MLPSHILLSLLLVLFTPAGVLSRRGSGGSGSSSDIDSNSDDYGDSDDSSSSSSGSTYTCTDDYLLFVSDLQPAHYENYTFIFGDPDAYTDWNGVYFQGESFFQYRIRDLPTNYSYYGANCPTGTHSIRMLGMAWVGPKAPTPTYLQNPFTLGFKAWQSSKDVADITYSYSFCDTDVDLVHLGTTVDWREYDSDSNDDIEGAIDSVVLNITQAVDNSHEVLFDGVYDLTSLSSSQMVYSNDGIHDDQIHLPAQACSLKGKILIGIPTGTYINGSMTNDTLKLEISGSTIAGFADLYGSSDAQVNVTFHISFEGSYAAANSSQVVTVGGSGQPLVSFGRATGAASATVISWRLMAISLVVIGGMTYM